MHTVYGVDEAGRGPILGPMVLAVVALDPAGVTELGELGVQDSKRFGSDKKAQGLRAELAVHIQRRAVACAVEVVPVEVIDEHTFRGQLNRLEQDLALRLLRRLEAASDARIVCDGARLFRPLKQHFAMLEAVDDGESAHVSVAAASILAKHARDTAFAQIGERYAAQFGPIAGGGYLNAATRRFLDAYRAVHGGLPPEARKSWGAEKLPPPTAQLTLEPVSPAMSPQT